MRITPSSKNVPVGAAQPAQSDKPGGSTAGASSDRVELSRLSQAASSSLTPDRVHELQAEVDAGTYEVNPAHVSRRMVQFYLIPEK